MATSTFFYSFKKSDGKPLEGYSGNIYLVPSSSSVNSLMSLTEDSGRPGQYFRENVPDGEYKIYIDMDKSGTPVESDLYKLPSGNAYLVWHGEKFQSTIAKNFNTDGTFKTKASATEDGAQSKEDKSLFDKMAGFHNEDGSSKEVATFKDETKSYPNFLKDYVPLTELSGLLLTGYPDENKISGTDKIGLHSCLKLYNIKANTIIKTKGMPFNDAAGYGQGMTCIDGVLSYSNIFRFQDGYLVTADSDYIIINTELSPGNILANKIGDNSAISVQIFSENYASISTKRGALDLVCKDSLFEKSFINESGGISTTSVNVVATHFIPVKPNAALYCSKVQAIAEYTANGTFIGGTYKGNYYGSNKSISLTTNALTRFIRVSSDATPETWNCRLYYGSQKNSADDLQETIINELGEEVKPSELSDGLNSIFDKSLCSEKSFINTSGGVSSTSVDIITSPKIKVKPNRLITATKVQALAEYDADDVYIPGTYRGDYHSNNKEVTFKTSPTTKYIRIASDGTISDNTCLAYYGANKTDEEILQPTILHDGAELSTLSTLGSNTGQNKSDIAKIKSMQKDILNKTRINKNNDFCRNSRRTFGVKPAVSANSYSVAVTAAVYPKLTDFYVSKGLANAVSSVDGRYITLKDIYDDLSNVNVEDQDGNPLEFFIWSKGNYRLVPINDYGTVNLITSNGKIVYEKDGQINITTPGGSTEVLSGHGVVEELKVITKNDRLFYQTSGTGGSMTLRYTDLSGDKTSHIIAGFENVEALPLPSGFAWSETTLLMGSYQAAFDVAIYRSLDNGVTWTRVVHRMDFKHVHGMHYDKYQDAFYAGLDSESNGILKSVDDGLTWDVMAIPTRNQCFVEMFSGNGFRLFAAEGDIRGSWSIYKSYDDIEFFEVLYAHQDIFAIREINGVIVATGLGGKVANRTACTYISYDNGDTWEEISKEKTLYDYSVGVGNKWISAPVTINGGKCLILGTLNSEGLDYTNKLLYVGGDNYQAWLQVKIRSNTTNVVFKNDSLSKSNMNKLYDLYGRGGQEIDLSGKLPEASGELNRIGWLIPETYLSCNAYEIYETAVRTGNAPTGNFSVVFDFKENWENGNARNLVKSGNVALGRSEDSTVLRTMVNGNSTASLGANCSSEHFEKHLFSVDVTNKKLVHGHGNLYNCDTITETISLGEIIFGAALNGVNGQIGNVRFYNKFFTEQEWYDLFNGADI